MNRIVILMGWKVFFLVIPLLWVNFCPGASMVVREASFRRKNHDRERFSHSVVFSHLFPHMSKNQTDHRSRSISTLFPEQSRYMKELYNLLNRFNEIVGEENVDTHGTPLIWGLLATQVIPGEDGRSIILWFNVEKTLEKDPLQAELVTGSFGGHGYHVTDVTQEIVRALPHALVTGRLRLKFAFLPGFWNIKMLLYLRQLPLLVLYYGIDSERLRQSSHFRRIRRSFPSLENNSSFMSPLSSSSLSCKLHAWAIDIRDLGWDSWMMAPSGFQLNYCRGQCPPIYMQATLKASKNAMIRAWYHNIQPPNLSIHVPWPCCVPIRLRDVTVMYWEDKNIVIRTMENVIAEDCGCI